MLDCDREGLEQALVKRWSNIDVPGLSASDITDGIMKLAKIVVSTGIEVDLTEIKTLYGAEAPTFDWRNEAFPEPFRSIEQFGKSMRDQMGSLDV